MIAETDQEYFERRAARHRKLAENTTDVAACATHRELSYLYATRSAQHDLASHDMPTH